ncbi:MAG: OPT family oligopeptide transporter [Candidatus Eiseniibacteriota bacterium]
MPTDRAASQDAPRTPEEIERHWYENVFAGHDVPQLTPRVVVMGMVLGMVMAASNVYVGLKVGWSLGVSITSCILAYTAFSTLHRAFPKQFPAYTILENNSLQSVAAAAGVMSGAGLVNAIPALMMLNPDALPATFGMRCLYLIPWIMVISWLGVFLAVPAKRQMINIEQLPYPTGIAAATTLKSLHTSKGEAARQAKALFSAMGLGAVIAWLRDFDFSWTQAYPLAFMPKSSPIQNLFSFKWAPLAWLRLPRIQSTWGTHWITMGEYQGKTLRLDQLTMSLEGSLLFIAAGAIIGFRQTWSMLLGAVVNYVFLAPHFLRTGDIEAVSFRKISSWSLWTGVPMLVTSGLLLFFMNWRTVVRAFSTIGAMFGPKNKSAADDPMDRIEVPGSWFVFGYIALGLAAIVLGHVLWHITWWMGLIAILATFLLVIVAARATGETDITPVGPLSKITQLTFGAIKPGDVSVNLLTANITAGAVGQAGDLLTDLKSGYLLGARPRQQFLAQFIGVFAGGLATVPIFFVLIPDASRLATERWPAPAALTWRAVAELLSKGVGALHPSARWGIVIGGSLGIILPLLERAMPRWKRFIPSPTGLGLAFTINGFNVIMMFLGSLSALMISRRWPKEAKEFIVPVSSGIIAGESLMGVAIALLTIAFP